MRSYTRAVSCLVPFIQKKGPFVLLSGHRQSPCNYQAVFLTSGANKRVAYCDNHFRPDIAHEEYVTV